MQLMGVTTKEINIPSIEPINLAALCRNTRDKLSLTQEEMAEILKTSTRNYRRWETGESEPTGQATAILFAIRDQLARTVEPVKDAVKGDLQ